MNEDLEKIKNLKEIYEGSSNGVEERMGYKLVGLTEEEKRQQLEEAIVLHKHLRSLEEKGKIEEFKTEEVQKGLEVPEKIKGTEEKETYERCLKAAENILTMFDLNPKKEDLLIITDAKVMKVNPQLIEAVIEQAKKIGVEFRVMVAPEAKKSATPLLKEIGERMASRPVLLINHISRSHAPETTTALRYEDELSKRAKEKEEWMKIIQSEKLKGMVIKGYSGISRERLEEIKSRGLEVLDLEKYKEFCKKRRARVVSITRGTNLEVLTTGAALEDIESLFNKTERLKELMKDVEKVEITSAEGANLILYPKVEYKEIDNGKVNKPGEAANFPNGEWSCTVRSEGTAGTIIVNGPCGDGLDRHLIGAGIKVEVKNGIVTKVEGVREKEGAEILENLSKIDEKARNLKEILEGEDLDEQFKIITDPNLPHLWEKLSENDQESLKSFLAAKRLEISLRTGDRDHKKAHPEDKKANAFKLAELGIGVNTKARRPPISLTAEKEYGTIHIAVGRNVLFGLPKEDPDYNSVQIHVDMIISGLTVKCVTKDGKKFTLIESGRPIGY